MKTTIVARKYEITDAVRERLDKKLSKLDKFFSDEASATVTMASERGREKLEVTITYKGTLFRAELVEDDMISAIDRSAAIIERQIRKNKTKLEKRLREGAFDKADYVNEEDVSEDVIEISKIKKFAVKPMTPEEAVLQMNLLGHEFFLFRNTDGGEINLVYKKNNGQYGLIEPTDA